MIALLGIVSLVAVPNVREWLVKREMEKDMSTMMDLVKTIGNNLGSNLYEMGGIFFDNNNGNGLAYSQNGNLYDAMFDLFPQHNSNSVFYFFKD